MGLSLQSPLPSSRARRAGHVTMGAALALMLGACQEKDDKASAEGTGDVSTNSAAKAAGKESEKSGAVTDATKAFPPTAGTGLAVYVGKYPSDKVDGIAWQDHLSVTTGIASTVKDAKIRAIIQGAGATTAPIELQGNGKLIAWGCEQHVCGPHQWAVEIDPRTGATDVCYFDEKADARQARWFLANGKEEKRDGNCTIKKG